MAQRWKFICLSLLGAAAAFAGCGDDTSSTVTPPTGCATGLTECGDACVNTNGDAANCGACGATCEAGFVCDGGGTCALTCQAGLTDCGGTCTNVQADRANCGACGTPCAGGEVCDGAGTCALSCQSGITNCDGQCVDTQTDVAHCGGCDSPCDPGEICDGAGTCVIACAAGLVQCGGTCIDPDTDNLFCGASADCAGANAGETCADGFKCDGTGACALSCQAGLIDCGGTCVDPNTDDAFCGATADCLGANDGEQCANGEKCNGAGVCDVSCQASTVECNGQCIDPNNNNAFCGATGDCLGANDGDVCPPGQKCNGAGVCAVTCDPALLECNASCVDPAHDPAFCGASAPCATNPGTVCGAGQACVDGGCVDIFCPALGGFSGVAGPDFTDGCWRQCAGYVDLDDGAAGDQIPLTWGQACDASASNKVRLVCGDQALTQFRYIDVDKNIFRDGLASFPESGLISDSRDQDGNAFAIQSNDIYATGDDPNTSTSWYAGSTGYCTQTENIMTVNNTSTTCREVDDCFGLAAGLVGQPVFLGVYVLE